MKINEGESDEITIQFDPSMLWGQWLSNSYRISGITASSGKIIVEIDKYLNK